MGECRDCEELVKCAICKKECTTGAGDGWPQSHPSCRDPHIILEYLWASRAELAKISMSNSLLRTAAVGGDLAKLARKLGDECRDQLLDDARRKIYALVVTGEDLHNTPYYEIDTEQWDAWAKAKEMP